MGNLTILDSFPLRLAPSSIAILTTAYLIVLIVGLVGNVGVIVVVVKMKQMKTATKYFILNLAISDLLVLLFCLLPSLISNIYIPWVMGFLMCKAVPYIQGVSVCASVYSLAAISADRLMAIWFPSRLQVTKSVGRGIIVLIWIWGAGLALPWLLFFDLSNFDKRDPPLVFCIEHWPHGMNGKIYFVLVNLGLFYLLPLSFISFCHLSIWLHVRRQQIPMNSSVSERELERQRANASVEKLVVAVVVAFAASWLPLYVIFVRIKLIPVVVGATEEKVLDYALPIAQWLGAANSCINPILYALFNRNFRSTLQKLLQGSSASTAPSNCPNPDRPSQGERKNLFRLTFALYLRQQSRSQLQISRHSPADPRDSTLVMCHEQNTNVAALKRSQTCQAVKESPC